MMKRLSALLLAAVMLLGMTALADTADLIGTWYLNTVSMEGTTMSAVDMGFDMTIVLNEDGTAHAESMGEPVDGVWTTEDGNVVITIDDQPLTLVYADGALTAETDGAVLTFTQDEPAPGFTPAESVPQQDIADFNGQWHAEYVDFFGMIVPMSAMKDNLEMTFGIPSLELSVQDGVIAWQGGDSVREMQFVDGHLEWWNEAYQSWHPTEEPDEKIELCADGLLAYYSNGGTFYCTPVEGGGSEPTPGISEDVFAAYGGEWQLSKLIMGGSEIDAAQAGYDILMNLDPDGTLRAVTPDGAQPDGVWYQDGAGVSAIQNGEPATLALDGDVLSMTAGNDVTMIFTRPGAGDPAPEPTAEPVPEPTAEPTAEPTPEPTAEPVPDAFIAAEPVFAAAPEDFSGEWIAVTLEAEGEYLPVAEQGQTWQVLFGSEDTGIAIDGATVTYFGSEPEEFAFEDGCLQVVMPHLPGVPDGMLDKRVELRADGMISFTTMNMTIFCERAPMDLSGYVGEWHAVYIDNPILKGNPTQWGVDIVLTLNEDGTGSLDYLSPDSGMRWYEQDRAVWYGDGVNAPMALALDEDGFLHYGDEKNGAIVFSLDGTARWSGDLSPEPTAEPTPEPTAEPTPEPTAVPTAEPTEAPTPLPAAPARPDAPTPTATPAPTSAPEAQTQAVMPEMGVRYNCVRWTTSNGVEIPVIGDPSAFTLYEDGSTSFILSGRLQSGITWVEENGRCAINLGDIRLVLEPTDDGGFLYTYTGMIYYFTKAA